MRNRKFDTQTLENLVAADVADAAARGYYLHSNFVEREMNGIIVRLDPLIAGAIVNINQEPLPGGFDEFRVP